MKLLALILISILHLSLASELCTVNYRKHDRAGIYSRNFVAAKKWRWPNKKVPYSIGSGFSGSEVNNITKAMKMITDASCIKFVKFTNQKTHTSIMNHNNGCGTTSVGYQYRKTSFVMLQKRSTCMRVGTIAHELLHVLGYYHEHTRPDRDEYLKIHWDEIQSPNTPYNWFRNLGVNETKRKVCDPTNPFEDYDDCTTGIVTDTFGVPYDYGSIMHYPMDLGDEAHPMMVALKNITPGVKIGQNIKLSIFDTHKLNMAYDCYGKDEKSCLIKSHDGCAKMNLSKCCSFSNVRATCKNTCYKFLVENICRDNVTNCKEVVKVDSLACLKNDFRMVCRGTCGLCQAKCVDKHLDCFNLETSTCNTTEWKSLCPRKCGQCNDLEDTIKSSFCQEASILCGIDNNADYVCQKTCSEQN